MSKTSKIIKNRKNWAKIIDKLNESKRRSRRIQMGSDGSAQVTRCRLLEEYDGLYVRTEGPYVELSLDPFED